VTRSEATFDGIPASVSAARRFAAEALRAASRPDQEWAVTLLVSELATNAVLHAKTPFTVVMEIREQEIRVAVTDQSLRRPSRRSASEAATTGRGLNLLDELSRSWDVEVRETRKTVWAVVPDGGASGSERPHEERDSAAGAGTTGRPGGDGPPAARALALAA
jgi:anti-sigma regulatory factor (Ser/Thr protein kinase)